MKLATKHLNFSLNESNSLAAVANTTLGTIQITKTALLCVEGTGFKFMF
jgi:hypothetical protein